MSGRQSKVGGRAQILSRSDWIHQISPQGPQKVLPAGLGEGWGAGYGQAGEHEVGPAVLLWLSFTASLQPSGQDFSQPCQTLSNGIPWLGRY